MREVVDDAVTDSAAQLSYYFIFALFPFLFFLATLTAYLPLQGAVEEMLARMAPFMPASAFELIAGHLMELILQPKPKLLTVGLVTSLWSASRGVDSFRKALNLAYDVKESRAFWRTQGLAFLLTFATVAMVVLALGAILLGGELSRAVFKWVGQGEPPLFTAVLALTRWPVAAVAIMCNAGLSYYFLPDVKQRFKFIAPGAVLGSLVWLGATWAFTRYVESFGHFNVTYGSIGGVVVLLLWLYVSGLIFILGGEVNATLEQLSVEGKDRGARAPGEAPPPLEERPSISPPGAAKSAEVARRSTLRLWWTKRREARNRPPPSE